MTTNKGR